MNYVDVFDQLPNVAQIARKCPTPVLRRAYVTALRDWCMQTQWLRVTIPGETETGTALYSLGSDPYLEIIGMFGSVSASNTVGNNVQTWPLPPLSSDLWIPNVPNARPRNYTYVPEGQFAVYPTPDGVYDLVTTAIVQPKEGVTQIPAEPLKKYSTYVEAGALAYLLGMKDTPWFNPAEGARQSRMYQSGISNGKAEVQRGYNTGAQRVRPRPFLMG